MFKKGGIYKTLLLFFGKYSIKNKITHFGIFFILFFIPQYCFSLSGETQSGILLDTKFEIIFQNPSYVLDRDTQKNTYICDKSKDKCKINFKLVSENGKDLSSKLDCTIDFGFSSSESLKCNPRTVIFTEKEHNLKFRVFEKENINNFSEKNLQIINLPEEVSNETETNSGTLDTGTGSDGSDENNEDNQGDSQENDTSSGQTQVLIPDIIIDIQSGLESGTGDIWLCKKQDCKVNLDASDSFSGNFDEKNYACLWDFGGGTFTTIGTERKCNPGYVSYPHGEFEIKLKISKKENLNDYKEKSLFLKNTFSLEENIVETLTGASLENKTEQISTYFKFIFQRPSYIVNKNDILDSYNCDLEKEECKINFKLLDLNDKDFGTKISCEINLSFTSSESRKCNPNTIIFPKGENKIIFRVYEKNNPNNFNEKIVYIINKDKENNSLNKIIAEGNTSSKNNDFKDISIQSGLDLDNLGNYFCDKKECKVNLKYQNISKQTCLWDFGNSRYKEKYLNTCNPGIIYFSELENKVTLKVFEDSKQVSEKNLIFKNTWKENLLKNNHKPEAMIKLQGIISKKKKLNQNKITCLDSKKCSINLDGRNSYDVDGQNLSYFWDFGNGFKSFKPNPASVSFEPGKYKIILKVTDDLESYDEKYFFVEVYDNKLGIVIDYRDFLGLKINSVLVNNIGKDNLEYVELINSSNKIINLRGLSIDDKIKSGSKSFLLENDLFLLPNKKRKFFKKQTNLSFGNSQDEVNIGVQNKVLDTISWAFPIPENFVITHDNVKENLIEVVVSRVIDGDTIEIDFGNSSVKKLRLIGVDTPETKHPKKKVEKFGKEASYFTKKSLEGKKVFLELQNNLDKYGRLLGYVYFDKNMMFNKILLEKGYARAYLRFPFKYSKDFKDLENKAKREKIGIWADTEVKKELSQLSKQDKLFFKKEASKNKKELKKLDFSLFIHKETFMYGFQELKNQMFFEIGRFIKSLEEIPVSQLVQKPSLEVFGDEIVDLDHLQDIYILSGIQDISTLDTQNIFSNSGVQNIYTSVNEEKKEIKLSYRTFKQKKSFKINGNTLEDSDILIKIGDKNFNLKSDKSGDFSIKISDLEKGVFVIEFFLILKNGEKILLKKSGKKEFSPDYIASLKSYKKRVSKSKNISKKKIFLSQNIKNTSVKNKLKTKNLFFKITYTEASEGIYLQNTRNQSLLLDILSFFIMLSFILFSFLVFRKYKVI